MTIASEFANTWLAYRRAFPFSPFRRYIAEGTPARKHKITDRAARKAKARAYALEHVTNGVGLEVARHGWQIAEAARRAVRDGLAAIDFGEIEVRVPATADLEVTPRLGTPAERQPGKVPELAMGFDGTTFDHQGDLYQQAAALAGRPLEISGTSFGKSFPAELCEDEGCPNAGMPHVCVSRVEPAPERYIVEQANAGWWVTDSQHHGELTRGPYKAKKTANRIARTLNGH